ncbi:hypothetical protein MTO96_052185 [Rhipicephalus appendiculatus]
MSVRKHVQLVGNKVVGYVDLGTEIPEDSFPEATNICMFMLVALDMRLKVPLGYFLIYSLSGSKRANLTKECITRVTAAGVDVVSLRFDGAASNLTMARCLGADLFYRSPDFATSFDYPTDSSKKVSIILDPCHMLKLVRNCLGSVDHLVDDQGSRVKWCYIKELEVMQREEEVKSSDAGNCAADVVTVLAVSSAISQVESTAVTHQRCSILELFDDDHDYTYRVDLPRSMSPFVEAVVPYVAVFVARIVRDSTSCEECAAALQSKELPALTQAKSRGGLVAPSKNVLYICEAAEEGLRVLQAQHIGVRAMHKRNRTTERTHSKASRCFCYRGYGIRPDHRRYRSQRAVCRRHCSSGP